MQQKALLLMTLLSVFFIFTPDAAHAQIAACTFDGLLLTTQVVVCVERVLTETTIILLDSVSNLAVMDDILYGLLGLYTIIFGLKVVTGETELNKKAWEWLFKFGLVLVFAKNLGGFGVAEGILGAMNELQGFIADNLNYTFDDFICPVDTTSTADATGRAVVWGYIDCLLMRVFGFGGDAPVFASAILGIVSAALFSGTMGILIFTMGVMSMLAILSLAFRAVLVYLMSYAVVSIMIIISPMIVPLVLFNFSNMVFDAWRRAIIGAVFLPAFITAYLFIAIPLIDYAIYETNLSLENVIPREDLDAAQRNEAPKCSQKTAEELLTDFENDQTAGDEAAAEERANELLPFLSLASDICKFFPFASFDLGEEHDSIMMRLAMSLMTLFIISWLVKKMLESIVSLGTFLMRGAHAISAVTSGGGSLGRYAAKATNGVGI